MKLDEAMESLSLSALVVILLLFLLTFLIIINYKFIIQGTLRSTRKRPIENVDITAKRSPEVVAGNRQSPSDQWMTNKMAMSFQEKKQILEHKVQKVIKQVQKDRVPVRRSQKVADKITALQKLVSPYGKTDTASVLHEASVFIKVLQDQIEVST